MENEEDKKAKQIDGNSIVSPKNSKRLYGRRRLDQSEARAGAADTVETSLPEDLEYVDENMFPSAP